MTPRAQTVTKLARNLLLAVLLGIAATQRGQAQRPRSQALIVALVDSLSNQNAVAMVYRYPDERKDMIVLRRATATALALGAALNMLDTLRQRVPVPPPGQVEVASLQSTPAAARVNSHRVERATAILSALAERPVAEVGKIGRGQQMLVAGTHASP